MNHPEHRPGVVRKTTQLGENARHDTGMLHAITELRARRILPIHPETMVDDHLSGAETRMVAKRIAAPLRDKDGAIDAWAVRDA